MAVVKPILEKCNEYGYKNPMQIADLETMKVIAAMIEEWLSKISSYLQY